MQITEKQKQQLIDLNDSRVNEILNLGLKAGKWYNKKYFGKLMFYFNGEFSKSGYNPNYGLNYNGIFSDEIGVFKNEVNEYYEATHQEVEQALIKEAKRRGFNEGVKVKLFDSIFSTSVLNREDFTYQEDYNRFGIIGGDEDGSYAVLFKDGVWAEIIDEKSELKEEIKELRNKLKSLEEKL